MNKIEVTRSQRLDQEVVAQLPQLSRTFAARLIETGKVGINGRIIEKPGHKLREGDEIVIDYDVAQHEQFPDINLPIIYEDRDCVVINKPTGLLSHSKGAYNPEPTVATWLKSRLPGDLGDERGGIVHRLDRATSGVMICAKTPQAQHWLQKQFSMRKVIKTYDAVVVGKMPHDHAIIDMPIMRNPKKPQTFRVGSKGKPAITEYWVQDQTTDTSLLKLQPLTGRTHQLRVHLSTIGYPIVGDIFYGGIAADRLYLHARKLELTLPSQLRKSFIAPTPGAFKDPKIL
jgi:23S rRNA pseudouridine1911/1915/1917 synthase